MTTMNDPLEQRVETMGSKMTLRSAFISSVYCTLPKIITEEGTAATNGMWVKFGRKFCDGITEEQLLGLGLHEASHIILGHIWRTEGYDPGLANVAQDAVINAMLLQMKFELPPGGVYFDWVTPDMDWEEVYRKLKKDGEDNPQQGQGKGKGQGQGQGGKPQPGEGEGTGNPMGLAPREGKGHDKFGQGGFDGTGDCDPCPSDAKRNDLEATILAAAQMARQCGDKSALIDRVLGKIGEPTVRWQDETRAMLSSASRNDYSFRRPSRRMLGQGLYLPSLYSETLGGLCIGWDMSGSMSDEDANKIAGELMGIWSDCMPDWVEVVFFDSKIGRIQRFEKGDTIELQPQGGGGTRFAPAFDHFKKVMEKERVAGIVFFTDLESSDLMKLEEPPCPVLWGIVNGQMDSAVPFGHKVRVAL